MCIDLVPQNFGTWLSLTANGHLVAAMAEIFLVECPILENDPVLDVKGGASPGYIPLISSRTNLRLSTASLQCRTNWIE